MQSIKFKTMHKTNSFTYVRGKLSKFVVTLECLSCYLFFLRANFVQKLKFTFLQERHICGVIIRFTQILLYFCFRYQIWLFSIYMGKPVGARTILCLKFHNIKGVDHVYDPSRMFPQPAASFFACCF